MNNQLKFVIIGLLSGFSALNLSAQSEVRFGIPHGTLTYTVQSTQTLPGLPPLKMSTEGTSSFDDYGKRIANSYTEKSDPGEVMLRTTKRYLALSLPGYYCLLNRDTREKIDEVDLTTTTQEVVEQHSITDYDKLTGTQAEIYTSQFIGTTSFLGKPCRKYRVTEKTPLYGSVDLVTVWNNIVLERITKMPTLIYEYKVVKVDENIPDASLFHVPID